MFSKTLSIVSFFGALAIGVAAAFVVNVSNESASIFGRIDRSGPPAPLSEVSCPLSRKTMRDRVEAKDLVGRWRGTFGYNDPEAMIYIDRVEGNNFYGNLTVHGALIAIEGSVDSEGIYFHETKVLTIDKSLGKWSLGKDRGTFSTDGRSIFGDGQDEYGTYEWSMKKDN